MATTRWSDQQLEEARGQEDGPVDDVVESLLSPDGALSHIGRPGYNRMLDQLDEILSPEGSPNPDVSAIGEKLNEYPPEIVNYFKPTALPEWVDPDKLVEASKLWGQNKLAIIAALYCISLPSCYLLKNGMAALYESEKLTDPIHIYQRIYETARFLDAVVSPGGLQITTGPGRPDDTVQTQGATGQQHRYVWGRGFVSAIKVRFLHSAMRYLLTHRDGTSGGGGAGGNSDSNLQIWDTASLGKPINQEDLTYTLLTFGYLIPVGLDHWGCRWTLAEKQAFLHLWKTVAYVMGIREELLTDSWDEAEQLFNQIRKRQAAPSAAGEMLASALMDFLGDYLPETLGIDRHVPPLLIKKQIGKKHSFMIFTKERERASTRLQTRVIFFFGLQVIRRYYSIRNRIFHRVPGAGTWVGNIFAEAGDEFINSWRSAYERRAFYVPENAQTWKRRPGSTTQEFFRAIQRWRQKVFNTLVAGVGLLTVSPFVLVAAGLTFFLGYLAISLILGLITAINVATGIFLLTCILPGLSKSRPKVTEQMPAGGR